MGQKETGQIVQRELMLIAVLRGHVVPASAARVVDQREQLSVAVFRYERGQLRGHAVHLALLKKVGGKEHRLGQRRSHANGLCGLSAARRVLADAERGEAILRKLNGLLRLFAARRASADTNHAETAPRKQLCRFQPNAGGRARNNDGFHENTSKGQATNQFHTCQNCSERADRLHMR